MTFRTVEWILLEDSGSSEYRDALGSPALLMGSFLVSHALGDQGRPFALAKMFEAMWSDEVEADDFPPKTRSQVALESLESPGCSPKAPFQVAPRKPRKPKAPSQVAPRNLGEGSPTPQLSPSLLSSWAR